MRSPADLAEKVQQGLMDLLLSTRYETVKLAWITIYNISCRSLIRRKKAREARRFWRLYVYVLAVGNNPYERRHTSTAIPVTPLVYLARRFTSTAIFVVLLTDQFDTFVNPDKTLQTRTLQTTLHHLGKHTRGRALDASLQ